MMGRTPHAPLPALAPPGTLPLRRRVAGRHCRHSQDYSRTFRGGMTCLPCLGSIPPPGLINSLRTDRGGTGMRLHRRRAGERQCMNTAICTRNTSAHVHTRLPPRTRLPLRTRAPAHAAHTHYPHGSFAVHHRYLRPPHAVRGEKLKTVRLMTRPLTGLACYSLLAAQTFFGLVNGST